MRLGLKGLFTLCWVMLLPVRAWGEGTDIFDFFAIEAEAIRTITASRLPLSVRQAPATIYVISSEDLAQMGVQTLWDALRLVPGVDVMSTRTFYGEVSIRGLNKSLNNRTLVLLDGKPALNGPFDSTFWEGIPVAWNTIDRIEVVLGPASALYGANALNGVINIITKTPEQLNGGALRYAVGERQTHLFDLAYGHRQAQVNYLVGAEYRTTHQFEKAGQRASHVRKFHGLIDTEWPGNTRLRLSGGLSDYQTQFAVGVAQAFYDGTTGYLRADLNRRNTHVRVYWNREQPAILDLETAIVPEVKLNSREVSLEQTVSLSAHHNLVIGGSARQDDVQSNVYKPGEVQQTQYALFAEHVWQPVSSWTVVSSGRWDQHSQTGWVFSPRTSLIFSPNAKHVFRLAAGSAFRNPTLTEHYVMQEQIIQTSFNVPVTLSVIGNPNLEPERVRQIELAHTGRFGPVRTTLVGFHYRLRNMIGVGQFLFVPEALPNLRAQAEYKNSVEDVEAWGGELGTEIEVVSGWVLFANYSHQHIRGIFEFQVAEDGGPVHKFNGGVRMKHGRLSVTLWGHWVGQTAWNDASAVNLDAQYTSIGDYWQLNMGVRYAFSGVMDGLSVGFQAFNMTNHTHFETLPARNKLEPGLGGEVMRRRLTGFLAYEF